MTFHDLCRVRQSCRRFDPNRKVEPEKIKTILENVRLSPSACNSQPYFFTVCCGEKAKEVAKSTTGMGMNRFTSSCPIMIVVSEMPYNATAAAGAKLKKNDYRSLDIGIATAILTFSAEEVGLSTCILGWFNEEKIRSLCDLEGNVRLVIALGYAEEGDTLRPKKRKGVNEISKILGE